MLNFIPVPKSSKVFIRVCESNVMGEPIFSIQNMYSFRTENIV